MKINSNQLIENLIERTRNLMNDVEKMKQISLDTLNFKLQETTWSALECIEHLNRYGEFYLPEIGRRLSVAKEATNNVEFKSGPLGNYFALSMLPGDKMKKMKTFKDKDPNGSTLDLGTLDKFIQQQKEMLQLLNGARKVDLSKEKSSISITKWIHFKLGDTFRFVIFHNLRHIEQAKTAINAAKASVQKNT